MLPQPHTLPVGGRIAHFATTWESFCSNKWVLDTVRLGLSVPFGPVRPRQYRRPPDVTPAGADVIDKEITSLLEQNALMRAPATQSPTCFYHSHFVIPKKEVGAFRHIINMRAGNDFVVKTKFKMESLDVLAQVARRNQYSCKVDIRSAFTHVGIRREDQDFFRLRWRGEHYRFTAMPFGYRDAPRVFTKLIRAALQPLRAAGICDTWSHT